MNTPTNRRRLVQVVTAAALLGASGAATLAQAQAQYPTRPIRIVVPHPAGDTTDSMARTIGEKLTAAWGQPVIVENKLGAGGMVAADTVAKAAPDGYTLLLTISSLVQNAILYPKVPYNVFEDFAPITRVTHTPLAYMVNANAPYRTVADFIDAARAKPGSLSYGSYGMGTTAHIYYELLADQSKAKFTHVPYKGGGPMMTDLLGGQVSSGLMSLTVALPQHRANKIRILAISNGKRFSGLPDVPTFAEAGYPDLSGAGWVGLLAPANTPRPIVDRLAAEFARIMKLPDVAGKFEAMAIEPATTTPAEFADVIRADHGKWSKVIKDFNIKVE